MKADTYELYRSLGYPEETLNTPAAKAYFEKSNLALDSRPNINEFNKINAESNPSNVSNGKIEEVIRDPKTQNPDLSKLNEDLKKNEGSKLNIQSTIKWIIGIGVIVGTGWTAYDLIEAYRDSMNGCWLLDTNKGLKYKIIPLTCNQNCLKNKEDSFQTASYCTNINGPCQSSQFNPMADILSNIYFLFGHLVSEYP